MKKILQHSLFLAFAVYYESANAYIDSNLTFGTTEPLRKAGYSVTFIDAHAMKDLSPSRVDTDLSLLELVRRCGNRQAPESETTEAKDVGLDPVMQFCIDLFPSNGNVVDIYTNGSCNFGNILRKLDEKGKRSSVTQIVAWLLRACNQTTTDMDICKLQAKTIAGEAIKEIKDKSKNLRGNCLYSIDRTFESLKKALAFEEKIHFYTKNFSTILVFAFCIYFFDTQEDVDNLLEVLTGRKNKGAGTNIEKILKYKASFPKITPFMQGEPFKSSRVVMDVEKKTKFADCVETTIRHFLTILCPYNTATDAIMPLEGFNEKVQEFFVANKRKDETQKAHDDWIKSIYKFTQNENKDENGDLTSNYSTFINTLFNLFKPDRLPKREIEDWKKESPAAILQKIAERFGRKDVIFNFSGDICDGYGDILCTMTKKSEPASSSSAEAATTTQLSKKFSFKICLRREHAQLYPMVLPRTVTDIDLGSVSEAELNDMERLIINKEQVLIPMELSRKFCFSTNCCLAKWDYLDELVRVSHWDEFDMTKPLQISVSPDFVGALQFVVGTESSNPLLVRDEYNGNILHSAAKFGEYSTFKVLCKLLSDQGRLPDLLAEKTKGYNVFQLAVKRRNCKIFPILEGIVPIDEQVTLLKSDLDVAQLTQLLKEEDHDEFPPILFAAIREKATAILELVKSPDINEQLLCELLQKEEINSSYTPLHIAAETDNVELFELVADKLSNDFLCQILKIKNRQDFTPLHIAAYRKNAYLCELLNKLTNEELCQVLAIENFCGWTPLRFAAEYHNEELLDFISKRLSSDDSSRLLHI
ncbi:MAG: ankyrin repeat domain-containing protein [Holosporaceae bacterium]|jgi:ankyrin repeat protein|nr:ankyrin repeat domain-containing protein [Holosporaceae bacterium]